MRTALIVFDPPLNVQTFVRSFSLLEIIKRSDAAKGFELLPRRWVVDDFPSIS